jgi:hypothetical protein
MKSKTEKEADKIDQLIKEGQLTEEDLPLLVREGLAQETVDFWRNRKYGPKSLLTRIVDFLTK